MVFEEVISGLEGHLKAKMKENPGFKNFSTSQVAGMAGVLISGTMTQICAEYGNRNPDLEKLSSLYLETAVLALLAVWRIEGFREKRPNSKLS